MAGRQGDSGVTWPAALLALLVSHVTGDVLLQTEWQARNKTKGLGDALARRALARHLATYTFAFIPALAWIGARSGGARALAVGGLIAAPHLLIDDGRPVRAWLRGVKRARKPQPPLLIAVDQSFHLVSLLAAAVVAAK
jgi:hypothetical protein